MTQVTSRDRHIENINVYLLSIEIDLWMKMNTNYHTVEIGSSCWFCHTGQKHHCWWECVGITAGGLGNHVVCCAQLYCLLWSLFLMSTKSDPPSWVKLVLVL